MVNPAEANGDAKPKTPAQLKKEAEKAAKLAKFEEKQKKLEQQKAEQAAKPKEVGRLNCSCNLNFDFRPNKRKKQSLL